MYWIECTISGKGEIYAGTLRQAIQHCQRRLVRCESRFPLAIWSGSAKLAEVRTHGEWVSKKAQAILASEA